MKMTKFGKNHKLDYIDFHINSKQSKYGCTSIITKVNRTNKAPTTNEQPMSNQ